MKKKTKNRRIRKGSKTNQKMDVPPIGKSLAQTTAQDFGLGVKLPRRKQKLQVKNETSLPWLSPQ